MAAVDNINWGNFAHTPSCLEKAKDSKWIDAALIVSAAALLIIGILASVGVFNFIGVTNAAFLSYGMYGGVALLLIAEAVKVIVKKCVPSYGAFTREQFQELKKTVLTAIKDQKDQSQGLFRDCITKILVDQIMYFTPQERKQFDSQCDDLVQDLEKYIKITLNHPRFRNSPSSYLENWEKQMHSLEGQDGATPLLNKWCKENNYPITNVKLDSFKKIMKMSKQQEQEMKETLIYNLNFQALLLIGLSFQFLHNKPKDQETKDTQN